MVIKNDLEEKPYVPMKSDAKQNGELVQALDRNAGMCHGVPITTNELLETVYLNLWDTWYSWAEALPKQWGK